MSRADDEYHLHGERALYMYAKELEAEIAKCYKMNCGRDYMHLPLSEAVAKVIKELEGKLEACEAMKAVIERA